MAPSATQKSAATNNADTPSTNSSDIEGKGNEWKFRAPYKIHSNKKDKSNDQPSRSGSKNGKGGNGKNGKGGEDDGEGEEGDGEEEEFKAIYEGGCHCGKVRYQLGREKPLASKFCHCGTCQRIHGAPFQHAAIFHKEDINFLKGHHDLQWYDSTEKTTRHKLPCKVSCAYCGSWIMDEGRRMILLFPGLIDFKDGEKEKFAPECHMFYDNRVVDINDGLPKWSGMQGESDLIADSPAEDVKKRKREVEEEEREERAKRRGGDEDEGTDGGEK